MSTHYFYFESPGNSGLSGRSRNEAAGRNKGYTSGWFILSVLTVSFLIWLVMSWLVRPGWLSAIPSFLVEVLALVEMALAVTLVILWTGLLWRSRRRTTTNPLVLTLDQLLVLSPKQFEHYVAALFRRKGYRVVVRGRSGDHGVDLVVHGDSGRKAIVQCKRYQKTVGEDVVRDLFGALIHERVARGFLVTTADISDAARLWAKGKPITLIDGTTLVQISASLAARGQE